MEPDFSQLYAQLGLRPDCTPEQLKQAYRRRVAELHPDRQPSPLPPPDPEALGLSELITLYGAAMQFHRQHGRLPGATAPHPPRATHRPVEGAPPHHRPVSVPPATPATGTSLRNGIVAVAMLMAVVYLLMSSQRDPAQGKVAIERTPAHRSVQPARRETLKPGLDMKSVLAIQGRPSYERETVWEYGPSWIRFEKGRVAEWYSSPLYPLRVESAPSAVPGMAPTLPDPRDIP